MRRLHWPLLLGVAVAGWGCKNRRRRAGQRGADPRHGVRGGDSPGLTGVFRRRDGFLYDHVRHHLVERNRLPRVLGDAWPPGVEPKPQHHRLPGLRLVRTRSPSNSERCDHAYSAPCARPAPAVVERFVRPAPATRGSAAARGARGARDGAGSDAREAGQSAWQGSRSSGAGRGTPGGRSGERAPGSAAQGGASRYADPAAVGFQVPTGWSALATASRCGPVPTMVTRPTR